MRRLYFVLFAPILLLLGACEGADDSYKNIPENVQGWKPVYYDDSKDIRSLIASEAPRAMKKTGKIYLYKQYLFVGEGEEGVHVFDNSDPAAPVPFAYIRIPYNHDIAIRDTVMYADTYVGLVAIGISKLPAITVLSVIPNVYKMPEIPLSDGTFVFTPGWDGRVYFECPDPSKGKVVAWEAAELKKPKCYHQR